MKTVTKLLIESLALLRGALGESSCPDCGGVSYKPCPECGGKMHNHHIGGGHFRGSIKCEACNHGMAGMGWKAS